MNTTDSPPADCDPPESNLGASAERLPAGTCDTHVHVFGPHWRYPLDSRRSYTPHECLLEDYRKVMRALGIDRAVLVQPSVYGTDNSAMLDALRVGGACFRGIAVPSPLVSDAELAEMHRLGVRGIRLNLVNPQVIGLDDALSILKRMAGRGWHLQVQMDLGRSPFESLSTLCDRAAGPVVVDHMGKLPPDTRRHPLLDLVAAGRCWVKLSAPYRVSALPPPHEDLTGLVRALADANPARVLWGSDWPHTEQHRGTPKASLLARLLHVWLPDAALRAQVCAANPAQLYGYPQEEITA